MSSEIKEIVLHKGVRLPDVRWTRRGWNGAFAMLNQQNTNFRQRRRGRSDYSAENLVTDSQPVAVLLAFSEESEQIWPIAVACDGRLVLPERLENLQIERLNILVPQNTGSVYTKGILDSFNQAREIYSSPIIDFGPLIVDLETPVKEAISSQILHGFVSEHLKDAVVIRFNVDGESEEREFFWADLNANPEELQVGARVVGETRLFYAPTDPPDNERSEEMKRIHQSVEDTLKVRGLDPGAVIGGSSDDEFRQESARIWAEDQSSKP